MTTFIYLFMLYLLCVVLYSLVARYTIYKGDVYIKTISIVKEGFIDFGKIFAVIALICGIIMGINYIKYL